MRALSREDGEGKLQVGFRSSKTEGRLNSKISKDHPKIFGMPSRARVIVSAKVGSDSDSSSF